jgi:DNA phosphorothioation-associated putative methyltransferase
MLTADVARYRTALNRTDFSRPIRIVQSDGLLRPGMSVMDYGCGLGGDVRRLKNAGFDCSGWDPMHAPDGRCLSSDVVNLGYVVNVIENPKERQDALRAAWDLTQRLLVVSARLVAESPGGDGTSPYADGLLTRIGTFQKFFEQQELRNWIEQSLETAAIAAAPGIFYVFRDDEQRARFIAERFRRPTAVPRLRVSDRLFAEHQPLLEKLAAFIAGRGRLPGREELPEYGAIEAAFRTVKRAFSVLEMASDPAAWVSARETRSQELLMLLGLSRFDRRQHFNELPIDLQLDVKAFFGSYAAACKLADELLFSLGNLERMDEAFRSTTFGKAMPRALYLHASAVAHLPILLRLFEGCARTFAGTVAGANIIKLGMGEPKISYLSYPDFDSDPHPALVESVSVHLQTFRIRVRSYRDYANPPILHRKEEFIRHDHPLKSKFERLTRIEEAKGLYKDPSSIGTRDRWSALLQLKGFAYRGHRLVRA